MREPEDLGPCPLCGRSLIAGSSINKHHVVPKSLGGREAVWIHRVCHAKIHSVFTERELKAHFHTFDRLAGHEEIAKFIRWVRKKAPTFVTRHRKLRK